MTTQPHPYVELSMIELAAIWKDIAARLGLDPDIWPRIVAAYSEPQRHYHTIGHIAAVVADFQALQGQFEYSDAALIALFFHDIVYDPARADNEERSAEVVQGLLSGDMADRACAHILATKKHEATTPDAALVVDIDMAILAAPWPDYLRYAENVAREYLPVWGMDAYAGGRCEMFLKPVQDRRIFLTDTFAPREEVAQRNVRDELGLWTSGEFAGRLKSIL
jgi:predicted metal-dependent HD superfamily phosphohydrolase